MKENLLIVFTKNPILGHVKTRLAKTLGDEKALSIFKKLLIKSAEVANEWQGDVWVFYGDFLPEKDIWTQVAESYFLQEGGDLGARMSNAFGVGLKNYKNVVLIGTDIPAISSEIIEASFVSLQQNDFVLGPAFDGGYYLVGMNSFWPFIFDEMEWSTPNVFEQTRDRILNSNYSLGLVKELGDVDYETDLVGFEWLL